jgi:hypothetical protein
MLENPWTVEAISVDRVRVKLNAMDRMAECAQALAGKVWHVNVASPVQTVEWKWPLSLAVIPGPGARKLHKALTDQRDGGPAWMRATTRISQGDSSDILFFPDGLKARALLMKSAAPVTADLLVLCGVGRADWDKVAAEVELLLAMAQAHAVLAVSEPAESTNWIWGFINELSHNSPVDVAASRLYGVDAMLWSTQTFIHNAVLSNFLDPLKKRIRSAAVDLSLNMVNLPNWSKRVQERMGARDAVRVLSAKPIFSAESEGASLISEMAMAAPPPAMPAPETKPAERHLLHKLQPLDKTRLKPKDALEAGKRYGLDVKIGPKEKGWGAGKESFPEPPVKPEEAGVMLAVVFTERNSHPSGELKTVFLPRNGASSECRFEFTVSAASRVFEGWISVYHNNRLLQEGVVRSEVIGGVGEDGPVPEKTEFRIGAMPRPLSLGLRDGAPAAGTVKLDQDGSMTAVRGLKTARVSLGGLKAAVEAISAEFDGIDWETMRSWETDATAAKGLSRIAQLGWQLRQSLLANAVMKEIGGSNEALVVNAAGAGVRVPLELCYDLPQPRTDAKVCPKAVEALKSGACKGKCDAELQPGEFVCPMGFWGLKRVIEWHSETADARDEALVEITNEPVKDRETLTPLVSVLYAQSKAVTAKSAKALAKALKARAGSATQALDWPKWADGIRLQRPSMLLLMPHVDHNQQPPTMEIQKQFKNPPGVDETDVVGVPPQQPLVLLLGCGAAHAQIDFMSLPAQFRRNQAALVVAPIAELLADDAPEIARIFIETIAAGNGTARPAGEVLLETKRKLLAEGRLAGLMLLAAGDASWLIAG